MTNRIHALTAHVLTNNPTTSSKKATTKLGCLELYKFHHVIDLPLNNYEVFDFTKGPYDPNRHAVYGVGKYNEKRENMYTSSLFAGNRNIHVGIDLSAPVNSEVYAFYDGELYSYGYLSAEGDYGFSIVTKHVINGHLLYALHGHLSSRSIVGKYKGQEIRKGQVIGWLGDRHENGGWNPHVHFQLSLNQPPSGFDMPGTVTAEQIEKALDVYIDPRIVLGDLY